MTAAATKTILITGCSSGIGLYCARALAKRSSQKWRVFAAARNSADVRRLRDEGLESLQLDVDDSQSIRRGFAEALDKCGGRLDALFNNAGFGQPGALEDIGRDALRAQFETNVFGLHELTAAAVAAMRNAGGGGRIIHNGSMLGYVSLAYRGAYNATKYAVEALADTMRLELAGTPIRVILIEPGPIESRFRANAVVHFRRNIGAEKSAHAAVYQKMESAWARGDKTAFTLPAQAVMPPLIHALESKRPRPRYRITTPAKLFWFLRRILPTSALDRILAKGM
jgi:NAD(P)-dependent dehydrogenase (short-subunit alcohol dehydrogenase family)